MDGLKLPVFLLIVVLVLGVYLFNPFSRPEPKVRVKTVSTDMVDETRSAEDTIKQAAELFAAGDFSKVIQLLEPSQNSEDHEIQRLLGYSYAGVKRFDAAILAFEKSLQQRRLPENGYSLAYLYEITGRTYVARNLYEELLSAVLPPKMQRAVYEGLARTTIFENDTRLAWKYNTELIKKYPDSPEGFIALIKILKITGKAKDVDKLTALGDKHHQENFGYNFWLGTLYFEIGNFDAALKRFKKCIALDPDNSTPYYYTYRILKRQKNIEAALLELEKYHKLNPLLPHIFFEAALDAKNEGKIDLAYKFIRSALTMDRTLLGRDDHGTMRAIERNIKKNGSDIEKQFLTAFVNYINGDYKVAREQVLHLTNTLKDGPLAEDGRRILRECDILAMQDARYLAQVRELQRQKELEQAVGLQTMAADPGFEDETEVDIIKRKAMINPNDLRLQYSAGLQLAKLGQIEDAKRFFDNSIRLNPNILEPNYSMARILIYEDNMGEARSYIDRALKINPNSSQTLSISATLYLKNNDFSRAKSDAEGALKANPNNGEARLVMAEVFVSQHDHREALQQINLGLEVEKDAEKRQQLLRLKETLSN